MLLKDFIAKFETLYPKENQETWDNSGLQVGDLDSEVERILLVLDVTSEAVDYAVRKGVDLIISHHPILFNPLKEITSSHFIGHRLLDAVKNNIAIYSSHTSIDVNGLNTYVFQRLGFKSIGKIEELDNGFAYGDYCENHEDLEEIIKRIKKSLNLDKLIYYGDGEKPSRIALVTGDGASFIDRVIEKDIDLYITGDVKHHDALDSLEKGLSILDIGHYDSEKLFIDLIAEKMNLINPNLEILKFENPKRYIRKIL